MFKNVAPRGKGFWQSFRSDRVRAVLSLGIVLGFGAVGTLAYWTDDATASGATFESGTLNPPTNVSVPAMSTSTVPVSWTAASGTPAPTGYYVIRTKISDSSTAAACGTSPLSTTASVSCNDLTVPDGTYSYTVTSVYSTWTAMSVSSSSVTVDTTAPSVTVTKVNGTNRTFPYSTNVNVTSIGGACGTAVGDSATVSPLIDGATTSPATTTCTLGTWTLPLDTPLSADGERTLSATQPDTAGNTGTAIGKSVTIDTVAPTVTINQAAGQADPTNASPINFTVVFSETVTGFNANNDLDLNDGTASGTESGVVTVIVTGTTYNVAVTGMTGDGTVIASVLAGRATDGGGNTNVASTSTDNMVTRDTVPTVLGVSSPLANGTYTVGQVIPVTVTFSEPVTVTGTPQLTLSTGSPTTTAVDYTSGSGSTVLTFDYTVAAGNSSADLAYASTSSLANNGGSTIRDAMTNDATLTLADPGTANSLGGNKNLVITS